MPKTSPSPAFNNSPVRVGYEFPGTALTAVSQPYRDGGRTMVQCRCICGNEKPFVLYNIGRTTKSCSGCHKLTTDELAVRREAMALCSEVPPARFRGRKSSATPEQLAAHMNYLKKAKAGEACASEIIAAAKALVNRVSPKMFLGHLTAATPEQLASHWAYMRKCVATHVAPTSIKKGKFYGFWKALETCEKPVYRTKVLCECILCGKTVRPVGFRKLREPVNQGCGCKHIPVYGYGGTDVAAGDIYGRWEVLEILPCLPGEKALALCKCQCGRSAARPVQLQALLNGYSVSCGCHNIETRQCRLEAGHRHGRLTVVRWLRQSVRGNGRPGDSIYLCLCDCGEEVEVLSRHLNPGPSSQEKGTLSCKCLRQEAVSEAGARAVAGGRIANARWLYDGVKGVMLMRSTWEIAVAEKLDDMGLEWAYEPESFRLSSRYRYTPDFYVPSKGKWYEVKAIVRDKHFFTKVSLFNKNVGNLVVLWQAEVERLVGISARQIYLKYEHREVSSRAERRSIRQRAAASRRA